MNRPIMKERYVNPQILEKHIIDIVSQETIDPIREAQRSEAVKTYNRAMDKVATRNKKTTWSEEELAARLDAASLNETHLYRQQERLNAFKQQQKQWNDIDSEREKVLKRDYGM